ncbi:MAG: hypothetical protein JNM93_06560 [Bacteriovoracaceae bacterium]|nr:hypothetical protein [Bacteriovoracaceae bacterium]
MDNNMTYSDMNNVEKNVAKRSDLHLMRKFWHMGTGSLALFLFYSTGLDKSYWVTLAFVVAVGGLIFDLFRLKSQRVNKLAFKFGGLFYRESEKSNISGLPFYALGVALSLLFYKQEIAILSIFFLVFSDPLSSLIGVLYGSEKILPNKSLQGSAAGFCTCYIISLFYGMYYSPSNPNLLGFALIAGLIGSISELLSAFNVDDNLTIPVVSGLGITIINLHFQIF